MEVRSQFRLPLDLHVWIKEQAKKEHRSINSQLIAELEVRKQEKKECIPQKEVA